MRKQHLNFSTHQSAVRLSASRSGFATLMAAIAVAAGLVMHHRELSQQIDLSETQLAKRTRSNGPAQLAGGSRNALIEELRRVGQVAVQLTIPWNELFAAIETAQDKGVALTAMQPSFQRRDIKISGEADDFGALRAYMDRLAAGDVLTDVRLLSHEVVTRQNATLVRFELHAAWKVRA